MSTEKDAMALAVLDKAAKQVSDWHPHGSEYQDEQATERFREKVREARAHLASRIAELEADNERLRGAFDTEDEKASVHWYGEWVEQKRRADRAEAELAAVRANAERYVWLRTPDRGHKLPHVHFKMQDDPSGECFLTFGDCLDAVIDAARGGE